VLKISLKHARAIIEISKSVAKRGRRRKIQKNMKKLIEGAYLANVTLHT